MIQRKNGLNDSDKLLITVALWISTVALFACALTLPMLPDKVTIFYRPADDVPADSYSKYNNLLIILFTIIPAAIILIAATLKKRNRLQNNFLSIMLFSVILSLSMGSIIIYGIMQQFDASSSIRAVNIHGLITMFASFILSMLSALLPMIIHTPKGKNKPEPSPLKLRMMRTADELWNVGAYGFLCCAAFCSFTPFYYCYIPFAVFCAAHVVFMLTFGIKQNSVVQK